MRDLNSPRAPGPRRALHGSLRALAEPKGSTVIGLAHVAYGAFGVLGVMIALVTSGDRLSFTSWLSIIVLACVAAARVIGGLWLADGRKRGAVLACAGHVVHVIAIVASGGDIASLGVVLVLALGVAALWVLPQLELPRLHGDTRS